MSDQADNFREGQAPTALVPPVTTAVTVTTAAVAQVLSGILAQGDRVADEALAAREGGGSEDAESLQAALSAARELDPEGFWFSLIYPRSQLDEALVRKAFPGIARDKTDRLMFLFTQHHFVEAHFRRLIQKHEGLACCADKSRHLMAELAAHLATGRAMNFNWSQKYTYHLSEKVFREEARVLSFFESLWALSYGVPEPFFAEHEAIEARLA